jgi:murein DD-endopeptidase MepM/ murein hydrolase activator NlpD
VIFVGIRFGYGNAVIIEHSFGYKTLYGHLASIRVRRGQRVKKGQIIGFIGISGRSTGPHLHFEVWLNNRLIDPLTQTNMTVR